MNGMAEQIKIIHTEETDSTISMLRGYAGEEGTLMTVVTAGYQTAGRGQGTNSWESERDKNLLLSVRLRPGDMPAARHYALTEITALAVSRTLRQYTDCISIKWPNDVYWRDMKISGTLSECDICRGRIRTCVLGTGVNINQQRFRSDAPNPVSLRMITGRDTDREQVLGTLLGHLSAYAGKVESGLFEEIHAEYLGSLYRKEGTYVFCDVGGRFAARIDTVEPDGHLVLLRDSGERSRYAFKEVKFII